MDSAQRRTKVFIHGLEGSSQGVKASFFRGKYPDMLIEDYVGGFEERMAKLNATLADKENLILVGSSLGGLMATVFACGRPEKIYRLILLAPALNYLPPEMCRDRRFDFPVILYHGTHDDVVPSGPVREIAARLFTDLAWHLVEDDHSLHETFLGLPWDELLS